MQTKISPQDLKSNLSQFTGTEQWWKHSLSDMTYTDGVRYFAKEAGCYWFLDIVGTEVMPQGHEFAVVKLASKEGKATIVIEDGNGNATWKKQIEFTDCPEGNWSFYLIDTVMLLPSEY